ncbi:SH3 domain-containing protein [Abyssibius alkaniclasticus]|uniref:SH3 domain-containing protein n=1 Tax=Abyssibius alkaniclasticus TaxID=2881234 RepID=UPI0023635F2D|nr:SH3 domain-containing protein [Abyssibius alkaniclasticus]UPH71914.1 SH3 domain-containing protein [Abyssibius alkaniclasticus]|tara:strand:+ start:392 stop:1006 length:615 start_codon:yes stop_codon:yes gene_type:complete
MKLTLVLALLFGLAGTAIAQTYGPSLYDVANVASDDVLYIRSAPDADSPSLGSLRPDARGLEVTGQSADGKWARVNSGEAAGWVALRFLRLSAAWADGTPFGLACSGTEPFWSIRAVPGYLEYADANGETRRYREHERLRGAGVGFADLAIIGQADGQSASMIISPASCNDGMSGREYALRIQLLRPGAQMPLLSGCCSMIAAQ